MMPTVKKWVFLFSEGSAQRADLLGGKGAGLCEMTRLASQLASQRGGNSPLHVPPGFVISTEACREYFETGRQLPVGLWDQILGAVKEIERQTGRTFGHGLAPMLVSVRSGAKISMPGMMDTILNVGLSPETQDVLMHVTGSRAFGYDAYCRLIQMFGQTVLGIKPAKFEAAVRRMIDKKKSTLYHQLSIQELEKLVAEYLSLVKRETGRSFPSDPYQQLEMAVKAVFDSWNNGRAVEYRRFNKISDDLGTAVTVQSLVFGNLGQDSGSGVVFTRNPDTGEKEIYGEYLLNAQGEDVVSGSRTPLPIKELQKQFPEAYAELLEVCTILEQHYHKVQDVEFTIERGKLWILQTRELRPTSRAEVKIAVDMMEEGLISRQDALLRVKPSQLDQLRRPTFSLQSKERALADGHLLAEGISASSGVGVGRIVFDASAAEEEGRRGESIIYVCRQSSPAEIKAMFYTEGIVASRGGASSHAALIARMLDRPCVVGCESITIDLERRRLSANGHLVREGETLSVDGGSGEIFVGSLPTVAPVDFPELRTFLSWLAESPRQSAWANATYPLYAEDNVTDYRTEARSILDTTKWVTDKAKVVEFLKLIPDQWRIRQEVVGAKDQGKLRELMHEVVTRGYWNGPRTCYFPERLGKAPWHMAMTSHQDVEAFIHNPKFAGFSGAGGYPLWIQDGSLREILVVYDPPELGLPEFEDKHFVFTVSCYSDPVRVEVELNIGTAQLRSIEKAESKDLIHLTVLLDPESFHFKGRRTIAFGRRYFKPAALRHLIALIEGAKEHVEARVRQRHLFNLPRNVDRTHQYEKHLEEFLRSTGTLDGGDVKGLCRLLFYNKIIKMPEESIDEASIGAYLKEFMRDGQFTDEMYETLIQPDALKVARTVAGTVFDEWWDPPFALPHLMRAIEGTFRLQTLEVQGRRTPEGDVEYMLVYDAKGREESMAAERTVQSATQSAN